MQQQQKTSVLIMLVGNCKQRKMTYQTKDTTTTGSLIIQGQKQVLQDKRAWFSQLHVCMLSHFSCVQLLQPYGLQPARVLCPWGFSRQEYYRELPCLPPGDLPDPGSNPGLMSPAFVGGFFTTSPTWEALLSYSSI